MVIIKFPNGTDWHKANWMFRRLAEDIIAVYPEEKDFKREMERAEGLGMLSLDQMEGAPLSKMLEAMRSVAQATVQGEIPGWKRTHPNDERGQSLYLESMTELLDLIDKQTGRGRGNPS